MTISKTNYNCNRLFLFLFLFFVNYLTISAVEKRTIHVATAGTLPNYISESEKYSIEELTLTGELNAVDFSLLRDMAGNDSEGTGSPGKLEKLDISQVTMIRGEEKFVNTKQIKWSSYPLSHDILSTGVNDDATIKDSYSIPAYLFAGCTSLKHIILPLTISSIGQRAFYGCPRLEIIDIPNSVNNIASSALGDHETYGTTWWVKQPDGLVYAGKVAYDYKGEMPENTIIELEPGTKGIAAYAFDKCRGMSGISIPESVTIIGECAFQNCSGLASVVIPNTVTSIGRHAFYGTAWYNSLPDGLVYAGKFAYKYKGTMPENTEIDIKDGTKGIAGSAFSGCSGLTSITIPNSVTSIGDYVFDGCNGLTSIMVSSGNSKYDSRNDCNAIIETSSNTLIAGCMNTVIPNSVTSIGNYAFFACSGLTSITIPNSVTSINYSAFSYCRGLTSIMIPNSVTSIGDGAFMYCNGLTSITIPTSVKSIGGSAFWGCSGLTSIMIPNSVTNIGIFAFKDCKSLTSITIPNSVKNIANYVFSDCNGLTTVISEINNPFETKEGVFSSETYSDATLIVPKGTKSAYQSTKYWNKFSNIVESTNENQGTKRTIHVATAGTLPNLISESEKYTIEELTLTGELNGTDLRLLRYMAGGGYYYSYDYQQFFDTWFSPINEPYGNLVFLDISGVKLVSGGDSYFAYIEKGYGDGKGFVNEGEGIYYSYISTPDIIPFAAFWGCKKITSITIPNSVTSIDNSAFYDCSSLTSISIPNSVTNIGGYAFWRCSSLNSIAIPNSVTNIGSYAFWCCSSLNSIAIPNSVTSIGEGAFRDCSALISVTIPNSVTGIGDYAFAYCRGLTSITLPNSITSIGNSAFEWCSGLKNIVSEIKNPFEIGESVFSSATYTNAMLTVPKGTKTAYQSKKYWNKFSNIVESTNENQGTKRTIHVATAGTLPNYISDSEKYTIEELTLTGELNGTDFRLLRDMAGNNYLGQETKGKLRILDFSGAKIVAGGEKYLDTDRINGNGKSYSGLSHYGVTNNNVVPRFVFIACDLENVIISYTATSIGDGAFEDCSGLTSITIPNSVTSIQLQAFDGCSGLTSITIPNSVTSIGDWAFYGCSGLTSIAIPNSVTNIGDYAFSGCSGLTSIAVSSGNTKYDSRNNCNAIIETSSNKLITGCKNTVIPNSVTGIGDWAFEYCSGLTSITIPNSVTSIGDGAFMYCNGLTSITIPTSVKSIGGSVFWGCSGLTSIMIPNSVTNIGIFAFWACSGLKNIVSEIQTPFEIEENVFSVYSTAKLTVPKGTKSAYKSTKYWNKFSNIVESGDSQESVTVTAKSYTREYGEANPTFEYTVSGGSVNGTPKITCSATKTSAVGSYTIKIEKGSVTNSNVTFVNGTLTITKAPLTITAKSYTRKQGEANPSFEVTYKGLKNNETESVLSKKPTVSTTATTNSSPGTYTISVSGAEAKNYSITYVNGTLTVTQKDQAVFTMNGIKYAETGTSKKVEVQSVDNNLLNVDIPSSVTYNGVTYQVTSVSNAALSGRVFNYVSFPSTITFLNSSALSGTILGAMIWNADASLSNNLFGNCSMVTDANFLLYVNSKAYAPSNVKNVIVGSSASEIVLKDAQDTWFYCPREFTAQNISYTHHYGMTTGGNGKGWETISLPFIVQRIEHKTKGGLTPFASYDASSSQRPFWLYEMGGNGFSRTGTIQANTPYIISMPNSANYDSEYILSGDVTFSATNAKVKETSSLATATSNGKRFVPAFSVVEKASGIYPLNVNNSLVSYNGTYEAGSRFIGNLRKVYPFEAYMTTSSNTRAVIDIEFDNESTGFGEALFLDSANTTIEVYTIGGQRVAKVSSSDYQELWQSLPSGVYVVNGKKVIK